MVTMGHGIAAALVATTWTWCREDGVESVLNSSVHFRDFRLARVAANVRPVLLL